MEANPIDSFVEFLALVEEGTQQFSPEQVQKLELIRNKVTDLVTKVSKPATVAASATPVKAVAEKKIVIGFNDFVLNEHIKKEGSGWTVTDSTGKKKLRKHPTTKKKALKQLQAIEISKHSHE